MHQAQAICLFELSKIDQFVPQFDVLKTTDKDLYHVDSSTRYVGGGSLGARKTTFNSA